MQRRERLYLEVGSKRTFAGALDWPGWSRSGRTEPDAVRALVEYGPRYASVVRAAVPGLELPAIVGEEDLEVVERLQGGGGTDFGVPGEVPDADTRPLDEPDLTRLSALLVAAWQAFDDAARRHAGVPLATGPRGGGRDIARMTEHVLGADRAYLTQLGARAPSADAGAIRGAAVEALGALARGGEIAVPSGTKRRWPPRYYIRRAAWHALDHAWEIEDRASRT